MKRNIYMIYDTAAAIYMGPLIFRADGEALREFEAQSNNADSKIGQNPEDFSLYKVGEFDDHDGLLVPQDKICLATALEMVAKARNPETVRENVQRINAGGTN